MDFRSFVNRESFKNILQHHLKNQIRAKFGNSSSREILLHTENELSFPDNIVSSVSNKICQSEEYKEFLKTFLSSLNNLFEDKNKYVPKEVNPGSASQCSSASSVNTASIDYISFDQFQDIISTLNTGINAEKLEALETFSHLPSLEHIIQQSLWPSVENGLHGALLSNVSFLKQASLKVYIKMLSSSEPNVVQESFTSLIKHILQNLLSENQSNESLINKCKCVIEVLAIINKFLQNISNHWLRYPQHVIENITVQSISILSYGSKHPKGFPVWLCIALCDKKSKWLKNILHGHVSRAYLLGALQKDVFILKYLIKFCRNFNNSESFKLLENSCCENFEEVVEFTHIICFISHIMNYSQGRTMLNSICNEESITWLDVLHLVTSCSYKFCLISCLNCCDVVWSTVSDLWSHIWSNDLCKKGDNMVKILLQFCDINNTSLNNLSFIIKCTSNVLPHISNICSEEIEDHFIHFICKLLKYLIRFSFESPHVSSETLMLLSTSITLVKTILSHPSNLFIKPSFIKVFINWCLNISSISKSFSSSSDLKNHLIVDIEQKFTDVCISMLKKPGLFTASYNSELFEMSLNILLEKILNDIKIKKSVCTHDIAVLSLALNSTFLPKPILTKSIIFKLSSIIWHFEIDDFENLPKVKQILEMLIPSIFPDIFNSEVLIDINIDNDIKLYQYVLLFPSLTKQGFLMFEEYNILALDILSLLTCSIISSCYLQAKYNLSDLLFKSQFHHINESGVHIIDPISVLQNHILVKLYTIGGFNEKKLPPETLTMNNENYEWPFFTEYPVPEVYYHTLPELNSTELFKISELNCDNLKNIFIEYIRRDLLSINMTSEMLKTTTSALEEVPILSKTLNCVSLNDLCTTDLENEALVSLNTVKKYGTILQLIPSDSSNELERLFCASKCLLGSENRTQCDIFISTISLIFKCDIESTWKFLQVFSKTNISLFIWHERLLASISQEEKYLTISNIIMEHCNIIVKKMLPNVYSALQFTGILPSVLFKYWTMLCYWNYLDFIEITHFVVMTVIFGGDFAIYFFVSVLKHLENVILKNAHSFSIMNLLKKSPIKNYKVNMYLDFILELSNAYQTKILNSVINVFRD